MENPFPNRQDALNSPPYQIIEAVVRRSLPEIIIAGFQNPVNGLRL
jgi:hypothetical protein